MLQKIIANLKQHFFHRLDVYVSLEFFDCRSSYGTTLKLETYLYTDAKNLVTAVGYTVQVENGWKKRRVFEETAQFDVASSVLKYAISKLISGKYAFVKPLVYFHGVNELSDIYFYYPKQSDKNKVKLKFFQELGVAVGGRECFIVDS